MIDRGGRAADGRRVPDRGWEGRTLVDGRKLKGLVSVRSMGGGVGEVLRRVGRVPRGGVGDRVGSRGGLVGELDRHRREGGSSWSLGGRMLMRRSSWCWVISSSSHAGDGGGVLAEQRLSAVVDLIVILVRRDRLPFTSSIGTGVLTSDGGWRGIAEGLVGGGSR